MVAGSGVEPGARRMCPVIVGIEQTTDTRSPETKIVRLIGRERAIAWVSAGGGHAWPGAADARLPVQQQNHHHRLREAWEMPSGWRMPTRRAIAHVRGPRPWEDRRTDLDIVAALVRRSGVRRIERDGGAR